MLNLSTVDMRSYEASTGYFKTAFYAAALIFAYINYLQK